MDVVIKRKLVHYLKEAEGKTIHIERPGSRRKRLDLRINYFDEESGKISISFIGGLSNGLPLYFWMCERVIEQLSKDKGLVEVGARLAPPYPHGSLEAVIWNGKKSPYKAAPHICDILADAGIVKYGKATSKETSRIVQAVKLLLNSGSTIPDDEKGTIVQTGQKTSVKERVTVSPRLIQPPVLKTDQDIEDQKCRFLQVNGQAVINWTLENKVQLKQARDNYSWGKKAVELCVRERNELAKTINKNRIENDNGIDLETLDRVMKWGFNRKFPLRGKQEALNLMRRAFGFLDSGDVVNASLTLMEVKGVGISRASKVLGLADQENLCIFDSRVGNALRGLKCDGKRVVLCPPGRVSGREYDVLSRQGWAEEYIQVIWVVQTIRDSLRMMGTPYNSADVEMALFMLGK
jgi:hypothetical protein